MTIRVSLPKIIDRDDMLELSACMQSDAFPAGVPERLIFSVAQDSGLTFSRLADTFLVATLPLAMKLGETIEVEGELSTRLAHGSQAYQEILSAWYPDSFQQVDISVAQLNARLKDRRPGGVGCCFSGGIDSFNAIMELCPPLNRYPEFGITHALMINGFDQVVDLERTGPSQQMHEIYSKALAQWGVNLVMVHTNLKLFRDAVFKKPELVRSFGSSLTACAHALAPEFGRFNLSGHATYAYKDLKPQGSHPALDHHLSSDQLQIIHLGARLARSEKLELMVDEAPVRQSLRVCVRRPEFTADKSVVLNCCECEKCIRTIVMLDIIGQLDNFPTFNKRRPVDAYKNPRVLMRIPTMFLSDLYKLADRKGRSDWKSLLMQAAGQAATQAASR